MNKILMLLLISGLALSSCKRELNVFGGNDKKFSVNEASFDFLTSKAKFKYNDGKQKIGAAANFRIKKDSVIWASISPALGLELARVIITRENIRGIDKLKKEYYEYSFEELSKMYGFQINYDLIEAIAIGNPIFLPQRRKEVVDEQGLFKYERLEGNYGVHHFIGKDSKKLEKLYAYDATTYNSVSVNYGGFQPIEGQILPQSIQATISFANQRRKEPVSIEIEYNRTELKDEPLSFPFNVSSKYKRK